MTKLINSKWMMLPVSAIIYLTATFAFWKVPALPPRVKSGPPMNVKGPSWEFHNPEADQLISELRDEKNNLAKRKQELDELATRMQAEREELNEARQKVELLQTNFDKSVLRVQEEETANLKKLAKVYSAMSADNVATIFADLDDITVAKILVFTKEAETAAILEALAKKGDAEAKRAAALSERLRLSAVGNKP